MGALKAGMKAGDIHGKAGLESEVAAFAAQLGFAGGASGDGFDDRDFRPPSKGDVKLAKRAAKDAKVKENKAKGLNSGDLKIKDDSKDSSKRNEAPAKGGKPGAVVPASVRSRPWRESVGPRPAKDLSEEAAAAAADKGISVAGGKGLSQLLDQLLVGEPWYDILSDMSELKALQPSQDKKSKGRKAGARGGQGELTEERRAALVKTGRATAERILDQLAEAYEQEHQRNNPADAKWLQSVRKSGTTADKLAAWTVVMQENFPANLRSFSSLLGMCTLKGKRQAAQAVEVMCELCRGVLLPERKLNYLHDQPLHLLTQGALEGDTSNKIAHEDIRRLVYWQVEDTLKQKYIQFVEALSTATKDPLEHLKNKAMKAAQVLLASKPEEENNLLKILVNKLGDPSRKVSSNAGYLMSQLLQQHRAMSMVVAREVEGFLFRSGLPTRARYCAIVFLNQLSFSHREQDQALAARLINAYFGMFKVLLKEAEKEHSSQGGQGAMPDVDARILSAIITGVRRAFPYVKHEEADALMEAHTPPLFALAHYEHSFPTAVQALSLLHQLLASHQATSDRFYRALYAALLAPALPASSKASMMLALVFKSLKEDVSVRRAAAFVKRLLQVVSHAPSGFACGGLLVVSELLKVRASLWGAVLQPEEQEDDMERFADDDGEDDEGDLKKDKPSAGGSELSASHEGTQGAGRKSMSGAVIDTGDKPSAQDSSDEEEQEEPEDDDDPELEVVDMEDEEEQGARETEGQDAREDRLARAAQSAQASTSHSYDMRKREPLYARAEEACVWELCALASHSHPSVAAMARTLLSGVNVSYSGDPLSMLSLSAFLDKFLSRKSKGKGKGGSSKMQPKGRGAADAAVGEGGAIGEADDMAELDSAAAAATVKATALGVSSAAFAALAEDQVAEEDVFFHKYYSSKAKGAKKSKKKHHGSDDEEDSDAEQDLLASKAKAKASPKKEARKDAANDEDEEDGFDDVQLKEDAFGSDTDDDESGFLDKELQREMGVKADEDDVDESEGEYDYEALAAAMSESEDGDQESGSSDDEANEMIDAKRSKNKGGKKADADALFSGLASENSESDASQDERSDDDESPLVDLHDLASDDDEMMLMPDDRPKKQKKQKKLGLSSGMGDFASADDYEDVLEAGGLAEGQELPGRNPKQSKKLKSGKAVAKRKLVGQNGVDPEQKKARKAKSTKAAK